MKSTVNKSTYHALAYIYDDLMKDIDYEDWSDFIDEIIQTHHDEAVSVLELACGTGTFALSLDELDVYDITGTDLSENMLEVARDKAHFAKSNIQFKQLDFYDIQLKEKFDVAVMLFDSMNYCQNSEEVIHVLKEVKKTLKEDGIFIFDFTTPANSFRAVETLNEEGVSGSYHFVRENRYLASEKFHYNEFIIEELDDNGELKSKFKEVHKQRIYTLPEMKECIEKAGLELLAAYDDFDLVEANEKSERITMVVQ